MRELNRSEMKKVNGGYHWSHRCGSCVSEESDDCSTRVALQFCQTYSSPVYCGYGPYPGECIYDQNNNLIDARPPECKSMCPN